MIEKTVGKFNIVVSAPAPRFVNITYLGQEIHDVHEEDVADLAYAVKCIEREIEK